ncbi:MAG: biopolymer transporter ExbD [Verrucomicrobiae bacterium]|nr:biopolymer transporter ExbD [Verrucomicrobiae bacterium]
MAFYQRSQRRPVINIVSLIDILVLLLIFFIVTTTFKQEQPAVEIQLPESKQAAAAELKEPIVIYVTEDNKLFWEKEAIAWDQLAERLKRNKKNKDARTVAMKADEKADFGLIIKVLDAFKEAGIENIPAFTEPAKKP